MENYKSQKEVFAELEMLRTKLSQIEVDPNLDLSSLASDVNGMSSGIENKKGCHFNDSLQLE